MYYFLGASLLFALLLVLNILISLAASVLWRVFDKPTQNVSAKERTQIIFALRVFPFIFTVIFVFAFLIPAYLLFEPPTENETVTLKLAIPALISIIGIVVAFYRVFGTWWRTRQLIKSWLKCSKPISVENVSIPVYQLQHQFPVIAVVGIFRPKLFIAEQIFSTLNEEELSAAIEHEGGHLATHDNFKRVLLRVCRDLLVFPIGKKLERIWAENSESAADEYATQIHRESALNLASALIKIAKIVPLNTTPTMPLGAFLVEQNVDVTWRVQRLIEIAGAKKVKSAFNFQIIYLASLVIISLLTISLATNHNFLFQIHTILEEFVAILQ